MKSSHRSVYVGTSPAITPAVFVGVVAGFVGVVSILVLVIICVFAMFRRQKEKNRVLESGTHTHTSGHLLPITFQNNEWGGYYNDQGAEHCSLI